MTRFIEAVKARLNGRKAPSAVSELKPILLKIAETSKRVELALSGVEMALVSLRATVIDNIHEEAKQAPTKYDDIY